MTEELENRNEKGKGKKEISSLSVKRTAKKREMSNLSAKGTTIRIMN